MPVSKIKYLQYKDYKCVFYFPSLHKKFIRTFFFFIINAKTKQIYLK